MPVVEICLHCSKEIDPDKKFVVVLEAVKSKGTPRALAHLECVEKASQEKEQPHAAENNEDGGRRRPHQRW
jgi:hypothetical protein